MCKHDWIEINDVIACKRCGLTRTYDGKFIFDRHLANVGKKVKKRRKKNAKT